MKTINILFAFYFSQIDRNRSSKSEYCLIRKGNMPEWRTFQGAKGHVTFESFLHESSFCHEGQLDASVINH